MSKAKLVGSMLSTNWRLNAKPCPRVEKEKADIRKVPYASVVGSLMYAMICNKNQT